MVIWRRRERAAHCILETTGEEKVGAMATADGLHAWVPGKGINEESLLGFHWSDSVDPSGVCQEGLPGTNRERSRCSSGHVGMCGGGVDLLGAAGTEKDLEAYH